MPKYKEYDFNYECDIDNIKVTRHVKDVGEIYINEDHVESEKKMSL